MHQNMVMNELPILVLVEIYQISGKDKSVNTFINMSVLPEENNANIGKTWQSGNNPYLCGGNYFAQMRAIDLKQL